MGNIEDDLADRVLGALAIDPGRRIRDRSRERDGQLEIPTTRPGVIGRDD